MARRVQAAEQLPSVEFPSDQEEVWRYTPIGDLDIETFAPTSDTSGKDSPIFDVVSERVGLVEVRNGWVTREELDDSLRQQGLFVGRLVDHPDAATLLGSVAGDSADYFSVLSDGFMGDAVLVDVPAGLVVEKPIVVGERVRGDGSAAFPRLFVRMGADSQASVVQHQSAGTGEVFAALITELDVADAARLEFLSIQVLSASTTQIGTLVARAGKDATVTVGAAGLGGGYSRLRVDCRLEGSGATGNLLALYYGESEQTLDFRTLQDHAAPHTTSNLLFKGALAGDARSVYTGMIRVRPEANGTNAFQTNRNIKLSEHAWAESVPNLEIETNDVRCSHASTVSPIDEEQLFYLESRGVPSETAERLIVRGFFADVLGQLPVSDGHSIIDDVIAAKQDRHQAAVKVDDE